MQATHIFSAKNIRILYIESVKIFNEMTLNELVKLTTVEQLGPDHLKVSLKNIKYYNLENFLLYIPVCCKYFWYSSVIGIDGEFGGPGFSSISNALNKRMYRDNVK